MMYAFNSSTQSKSNNDANNKLRESIIGAIINNEVPYSYYAINKWSNMKTAIHNYINLVFEHTK